MWSQWYFSLSIWQVHLGLLENIKMCLVTKSYKKKCKHYLETYVWMCLKESVYVPFSMFKSWFLMFCWRKKKQLFWCYDLPTLHWVSSTPHSANRRWTKVWRGDGDNSCVHVYSRTFKNVLFFFFLSVKFTYLIVAFIVEYSSLGLSFSIAPFCFNYYRRGKKKSLKKKKKKNLKQM